MRLSDRVLTAALVAGLVSAPSAASAGLGVSPALVDVAVKKSGENLAPIRFNNTGPDELECTVEFAPLAHDLSGQPGPPSGEYKYAAHKWLVASPAQFLLPAGGATTVDVKVNIPKGAMGGGYAAMYVLGRPVGKSAKGNTIVTYTRVAVLIEMALPGAVRRSIRPGRAYARQHEAGGPVTLFASAMNQGDVHVLVKGTILVTNEKGVEVANVPLSGGNVFPELTRTYSATWRAPKTLFPGKYKITASMEASGGATATTFGEFQVLNPGELAQTGFTVTRFAASPVVQRTAIPIQASVINQGNVPFAPRARVSYVDARGAAVGIADIVSEGIIQPRTRGFLTGSLPGGLASGTYRATLEVLNEAGAPIATFNTSQQVIDKQVVLAGRIAKLSGPNPMDPFVTLEFANQGNVDLDTEGVVMVADGSGNIVGQIALEKQKVAPGKSVSYKRAMPDGLDAGLYELRAVATYGGNEPAAMTIKHFVQK